MFSFSPAQAYAFYGFLEDIFVEKLRSMLDSRIRKALQAEFKNQFHIDDAEYDVFTTIFKHKLARSEVNTIIAYMSGVHPDSIHTAEQLTKPGPARCLALLYRGENTIQVIREKLGSTDPSKAAVGTIRSDYGRDIMKNGAHASDSIESMTRERRIIGFTQNYPSMTKKTIEYWLSLREKMEWEKLGI
uniref:Nucleoside diphosphate kinase n=1 Tax=Lygus hesperus TaxID=30085 RepID=A0A0A9X172_LYGHE